MADPNAIRYGGAFVEIFAVLDPLDRDLKKGEKMVHDSAARMKQNWANIASRLAPPLTIAAAAGAFLKLASSMDDLADEANRMDAGVEGLQKLQLIAKQSGAGVETVNKGLQEMRLRIAEAFVDPAKADLFRKLNLDVAELRGMKSDEVFVRIAEAVSKTGNSMERLRIETELFGKAGKQLDLVLREVAKGGFQNVIPKQTVEDLAAAGGYLEQVWQNIKVLGAEAGGAPARMGRQATNMWVGFGGMLASSWPIGPGKWNDYQATLAEIRRLEQELVRNENLARHFAALGDQGDLARQALEKLTEPMQGILDKQMGISDPVQPFRLALTKAGEIEARLPKVFRDLLDPQIESLRNQVSLFDAMKETAEVAALVAEESERNVKALAAAEEIERAMFADENTFRVGLENMTKAIMDRGLAIAEAVALPQEKYEARMADLSRMYEAGAFGHPKSLLAMRTFQRAQSAAEDALPSRSNWVGGGLAGSADAYLALYGNLFGEGATQNRLERIGETQVRKLGDIERAIREGRTTVANELFNLPAADL